MRVTSPLADVRMYIGRVTKSGANLVIESGAASTMAVEVNVSPEDAWQFVKALAKNPAALLYLPMMPFAGMFKRAQTPPSATGSRLDDPLNKPW